MLRSCRVVPSSLRESSPFGDIVRSHTGAAHSRVVVCLRSPSEMGGLLAGYIQSPVLFFITSQDYLRCVSIGGVCVWGGEGGGENG